MVGVRRKRQLPCGVGGKGEKWAQVDGRRRQHGDRRELNKLISEKIKPAVQESEKTTGRCTRTRPTTTSHRHNGTATRANRTLPTRRTAAETRRQARLANAHIFFFFSIQRCRQEPVPTGGKPIPYPSVVHKSQQPVACRRPLANTTPPGPGEAAVTGRTPFFFFFRSKP